MKYENAYIVFDDKDFKNHHTHIKSHEIATVVRNNVKYSKIPKTKNIRLIESHIRVASDPNYITLLKTLIKDIKNSRNGEPSKRSKSHNYIKQIINLRINKDKNGDIKYDKALIKRIYQLIYKLEDNQPVISFDEDSKIMKLDFINNYSDVYRLEIGYALNIDIVNIYKSREYRKNMIFSVARIQKEIQSFLNRKVGE